MSVYIPRGVTDMRKMKILLLVPVFLCLMAGAGYGQSRFQFAIDFSPLLPQGEFSDYLKATGLGGTLDFTYRLPRSALSIGTSLGFYVYGVESWWEPVSLIIPDVLVKVSTINAIIQWHFLMRLQPEFGLVRPYLDGLIGIQHLTTDTQLNDNDGYDEYGSSTGANHINDTVLSYGFGGGLMFRLLGVRQSNHRSGFSMDLEMGVRYLRGGFAEYLTKGDIVVTDTQIIYYVSESRTDAVTGKIGLSFSF